MPVFISLIRGINVGGPTTIKMDALRTLCESLGLRGARTYLQSGNVVFQSKEADPARLARRFQDGIEKTFGLRVEVMLRTTAELRDVIARNPFSSRTGINPSRLLVMFLAREPEQEAVKSFLKLITGPEELRISGKEAYLYYPDGIGHSKLTFTLIEKKLATSGTTRNWNTVTKLLELAEGLPGSGPRNRG
jgi:uncharacterized protein (DUF1697 family)